MNQKSDIIPILEDLKNDKINVSEAAELISVLSDETDDELRNHFAKEFLCALLQNPERYKYVTERYKKEKLTDEAANMININKAFHMADSFLKTIE